MGKEIYNLEDFLKELDKTQDPYAINKIAENLVCSLLDAEFSSLWYYDKTNMKLIRMREGDFKNEIFLDEKKGILYKCFMTQESFLYNYLASDKDYVASIDNPDNIKIKSKIMVPLIENGEFVGIVTAYNSIKKYDKFTKEKLHKLQSLRSYMINALYKIHGKNETQNSSENLQIQKEVSTPKEMKSSDETLTFVANFVHDIRTPANALYGFLDMLEDQIKDEKLRGYIINAKESANFINELTTSVLNVVSTHKESSESDIKQIETIPFFSSIAETFSSNMFKKNLCYNIFIDPLLPKNITIDALKLKRVILNLLGNAYKFTPNNKKVEFSVRYVSKTNKIVIYIKDTGVGIPKDKQKEIFKAFKQSDEKTAIEYGGTGLGLFISSKYVRELGGTLGVVSEVDIGSTFSFDIPVKGNESVKTFIPLNNPQMKVAIVLNQEESFCATNIAKYMVRLGVPKENVSTCHSMESVAKDISHIVVFDTKATKDELKKYTQQGKKLLYIQKDLFWETKNKEDESTIIVSKYSFYLYEIYKFINSVQPPKVLIVDDDAISIKLIESILENEFCDVTTIQNGQDALYKVIEAYENKEPYDYIYIDNKMPLMNGSEVMRRIREYELQNNITIPVFAISTSGEHLDEQMRQFYDVYIGKPFKKEDVRSVLQRR